MANQITGRIIEIGQTVQIPSKSGGSPFTKREFILDATGKSSVSCPLKPSDSAPLC